MNDSDIPITRGKKQQYQNDGEKSNINTLVKELKKYFHTKLDAIKDQFTEENEKLAMRTKIDPQPKLRYRSN